MSHTNPEIYAVPDAERAGAIVYWRLSGTVDALKLTEAWQDAGLADALLPETPTPDAALRRAVYEQKARRRLVRKLPNGKGWAIVEEKIEGDDLAYAVGLRVTLNKIGRVALHADEDKSDLASVQVIGGEIVNAFDQHLDHFSASDISAWLVHFAAKCGAVSLRERGGIYFVPRDTLPYWRKAVAAIASASDHSCYEIPALKSDEAVDAILDAVMREAQSATDAMADELETGELQARALCNREEQCTAILAKLKQYEALLGRNMGTLTARVDDLKADIAIAALAVGEI